MYKLKKNSIRKNISKLMSLLLAIFFLFMCVSFAGEASISPLNILNKRTNSAKKNLEINSARGKAVIKDLYSNSLKQVELNRINPMLDSVKATTVSLNNNYLCDLKDNDIINILYKSNDDFKKELRNISIDFKKPEKRDMIDSCAKLTTCILSTGSYGKVVDSLSYCKLIVNDYYTDEYKNSYNLGSLTEGNKGSDAFRNNTLSDSSYDILNDIYILARIFFDAAEEPSEILFYDMPSVGPAENIVDPYVTMVNDRFSPYYQEGSTGSSGNGNGGGGNGSSGNNGGENSGGGNSNQSENNSGSESTTIVAVEGDIEYEIMEFAQTSTYEVEGKEGYEFLGNDCIDEFAIEGYDGYSYDETITGTINTPTEYWTTIINTINAMVCENDDECNNNNPNNGNNPDGSTNSGNSTNPNNGNNTDDLFDQETLSCFQSCETVPCNATSCDRLACYAKCLCISYESPTFDPAEHPGLGPIFKLKFCIQPVQDHKIEPAKKVNTLESIVNSINVIIQDLRNSGELMINKKTKELLDAGFQNNEFSQISFSIDGFPKTPETKQSTKQQKENQIKINTSLMESILGFEKEETVNGNGRNKYIIKGGAIQEGIISNTDTTTTNDIINEANEIIGSLKTSHINNMGSKVYDFLQGNLEFWQSFKESMDSLKVTAKSLSDKK